MMPTFAKPDFLWMLPALVPLLLLRLRAHRLSSRGTPGLVADRLRSELIIGATPWLRWLTFFLQTLALALVIIALARPQWGYEEVATESEGRNVIIAVDTSRSMLANDLLPDRLTRAKLAAQDLVDSLPNDRIGLIAFAGSSFLQAPLTMDHMAIGETISQLDTEIIPLGGTNLTSAVTMAIETFQKAESKDSALILFSDGEEHESDEVLAKIGKDAEALGLIIIAIGVGTEGGSIIPDPDASTPGTFIKDDEGNIVRTRLDSAALRQLSSRTSRGLYLNLGATNSITQVVGQALKQIDVTRYEDAIRKRPIERFIWVLALALLSMVLGFLLPVSLRRKKRWSAPARSSRAAKKALALVLTALLITRPCKAETEATAVKTPGLPALEAYQNENYKAAVNRYQQEIEAAKSAKEKSWLEFGLGSAAYRTGDFELAEQSFGKVLERKQGRGLNADAHYNLGNALFRHGQALLKPGSDSTAAANASAAAAPDLEGTARQWEAAIEHYQATLEVAPGHELADENLKIVGRHLEQLREQQQQQKEQQKKDEQQEEKDKEEEKDKGQDQDQDKKENQNQDDKGEGKDQQQQPDGSKGNQAPPDDKKSQDGKDGKDDENKQQAPSSDPQNPGDQKDKPGDQSDKQDKQDPSEGSPGKDPEKESKGKPGDQQQEPQAQGEPESQPQQPEGNLKADPNQQQPAQQSEGQADRQPNPETGFSPLEARRLLQSLSDEDLNVKPLIRSVPARPYKNW